MSFNPIERWQDAVDAGARGNAAAARSALAVLAADPATSPAIRSLSFSTRASLLRQSGGHGAARVGDGRACALVAGRAGVWSPAAGSSPPDVWSMAGWLDGLIGLAADNLGLGAFAQARRLLDRAAADLAGAEQTGAEQTGVGGDGVGDWRTLPRVALRLAWVRAEWGLYSGDLVVARQAADLAARRAATLPSPRHAIKTRLIGAAASAATGHIDAAVAAGVVAHTDARDAGLLPLQWAAATLLAGVCGNGDYQREVRDLRAELARRGMPMMPLEPGERLASIR